MATCSNLATAITRVNIYLLLWIMQVNTLTRTNKESSVRAIAKYYLKQHLADFASFIRM